MRETIQKTYNGSQVGALLLGLLHSCLARCPSAASLPPCALCLRKTPLQAQEAQFSMQLPRPAAPC
jgi:hypothetical protein